jgi:hypothetical protein
MAQSQDLELEVKARTKDRTQCVEKCEQGSGHWRREFEEQYNSFPPPKLPPPSQSQVSSSAKPELPPLGARGTDPSRYLSRQKIS